MNRRKADNAETKINRESTIAESGFTLLEVMAAIVILGVSLTAIMTDRNESIRRVAVTDSMRTATMLAQQKMNEIVLGLEVASSGDFDGFANFSWRIEETGNDFKIGEEPIDGENWISLIVIYPVRETKAELILHASVMAMK